MKRILLVAFSCLFPLSTAMAQEGSEVLVDGQQLTKNQLAIIMASVEDCSVEEPAALLDKYREGLVTDDPLGGILSFNDIVMPYVTKIGEMEETVLAAHCEQVNNFVSQLDSE
ncbi:hypothetical protein [Fulvimarina sp. MAC8]|uniref:hypothetical protein n=1 Tax=Fulvimarina sp. MAC8 TaxID=3162874 RepID=UPI0032EF6E27